MIVFFYPWLLWFFVRKKGDEVGWVVIMLMWKRKSNVDDDNVKVINIGHFRKIAFGKLEVNHSYPLKNARKTNPQIIPSLTKLRILGKYRKVMNTFLDRLNPRVIVPFLAWSLGYEITPRKKVVHNHHTTCWCFCSRPTKKDHDFSSPLTLPPQELQPNRLNPTKITF